MNSEPQSKILQVLASRIAKVHAPKLPVQLIALVILLLVGCQSSAVSDPAGAREVLQTALKTWQEGKTTAEMRSINPPVYVAEDLWENGNSLVEFSIDAADQMIGENVCFEVSLKTKSPSGQLQTKKLKYLVTTTPALTIARLDL